MEARRVQILPDPLILEMVNRLLESVCDSACIDAVEAGQRADQVWEALAAGDIQRAWIPESDGGGGASLADVCAIASAQGRHAAPIPLSDTLLCGQILAGNGIELGDGPFSLSLAAVRADELALAGPCVQGVRRRVPFAAHSDWLLVQGRRNDRTWMALFATDELRTEAGRALSGEPQDTVYFDDAQPAHLFEPGPPWDGDGLRLAGALLRAQQMAGALSRILDMSLGYAREREAFGRPIARFQAVQHNLAMLAGEVAAASAAANAGMMAAARHGFDSPATAHAVAAAKIRTGEAAGAGAAIAHQVHGAMGFTHEHRLHQFTRRLWSWRDEYGTETEWAMELGRRVAAAGAQSLWPGITAC